MGLSPSVVSNAFHTTNLLLTCQGQTVPCSVLAGELSFRGQSALTNRVPENVYWLQLETGVSSPPLPPETPPANDWVLATTTVQGTNVVSYSNMGTLTNLPSFLAFNLIQFGKSFTVTNSWTDGVSNLISGSLSVSLLSAAHMETAPDQHTVRVSVNGYVLGTENWEGESYQTYTYALPGELLTNGTAVIGVSNLVSSGTSARFFWTKYALTVARRADLVLPVLRPSVRGVSDADGFVADNTADYVVLIPPEGWVTGFRETLQPLVDFRKRQGLRTAVLDVEALYNRYTYGLARPEAIHAFCVNAYNQLDVKLRYLLLAGSGTMDFAQEKYAVTHYQSCLIPPLIAGERIPLTGEAMLVAVDQAFGDVEGDAAPEIAVGRFPTAWTQELAVAVEKTLAYESTQAWKGNAALSAGTGFTQDMDITGVPLLAAGKAVTTYYTASLTTWNSKLKAAFQSGVGSFWYIGHSADTYIGDSANNKLLEISTLKTTAWAHAPVAFLLGCHLNRWQGMNVANPLEASCLGPFSVFRQGTGFSAVVASTGYAADGNSGVSGEAQMLAYYLALHSGSNGVFRIGDAFCSALSLLSRYDPPINPIRPYYDPPPITPERLLSYSLVGDPALMWRHDFTGTGTPVSWLQGYGLTAWDGDVSDLDNDGWSAWQEYQAGTRPDTNRFVVAGQSIDASGGAMGLTFETAADKNYRILWKYALEDATPWTPVSWALPGQIETLHAPDELIIPSSARMTICVPVRPGDTQGFFRIQQE
jgi:hypothetical protein